MTLNKIYAKAYFVYLGEHVISKITQYSLLPCQLKERKKQAFTTDCSHQGEEVTVPKKVQENPSQSPLRFDKNVREYMWELTVLVRSIMAVLLEWFLSLF